MKRVGNHEPGGDLNVGQVTVIISSFHELDTILLWSVGHQGNSMETYQLYSANLP